MPKPLNQQSGMPQMSAAFSGWLIAINLIKIIQQITDGFVYDVEETLSLSGTWQPLSMEEIALKPDGQRSWEWIDLHVKGNSVVFQTNDRLKRDGVTYKVMAVKDWRLNNYTEYHLVRDYDYVPPSPPQPIPNFVFNGMDGVYDGFYKIIDGYEV